MKTKTLKVDLVPTKSSRAVYEYAVYVNGVLRGAVWKKLPNDGRGWRWESNRGGYGEVHTRAAAIDAVLETSS